MATYKRIVRTFEAEYSPDIESKVKKFCDNYSDYKVVSCSIATEKHGYTVSYVAIVVLEKEV